MCGLTMSIDPDECCELIHDEEECGARYSIRWIDYPSDQWDVYTCIQYYGHPGPHNDGHQTRWAELKEDK